MPDDFLNTRTMFTHFQLQKRYFIFLGPLTLHEEHPLCKIYWKSNLRRDICRSQHQHFFSKSHQPREWQTHRASICWLFRPWNVFCFWYCFFLGSFESEARGSRRNKQLSPVPVRLTAKGKERTKAKLRHLLPNFNRNEGKPLIPTRASHPLLLKNSQTKKTTTN